MKKISVIIYLFAVLLICLCGCRTTEREYNDDVVYQLQNEDDVLIIREWRFLLGSGAEIYYVHKDSEPLFLGQTPGADDGYFPFKEGMYEIKENGDSIEISWCFNPSDRDRSAWHTKTFELPG